MNRATLTTDGGDDHSFMFQCPGCARPHAIPVTGPQAWTWNGRLDQPTIEPSILVFAHDSSPPFEPQPRCHSFVRDGKIQFQSDCDHPLAGKTVDVPEWSEECLK